MPASRRARATILAPRSWPSRPGLATRTRILRSRMRLLRKVWEESQARSQVAESQFQYHIGVGLSADDPHWSLSARLALPTVGFPGFANPRLIHKPNQPWLPLILLIETPALHTFRTRAAARRTSHPRWHKHGRIRGYTASGLRPSRRRCPEPRAPIGRGRCPVVA